MGDRLGVVVGIDGSEGSRAALAFALWDAVRRGTGVQLVSVFLPPQYRPEAYWLAAPPTVDQVKDELRVIARRMIDGVVAEHPGLAAVPVDLHELEGHPARVLIDQARGADVLVVGHRGRGGFASALLGSVGLQCVLHAECPVTVVRSAPRPETTGDAREGSAEPAQLGADPAGAPIS
jgi:nucleotide-binding universal stress UspA family protein